MQPGQIKALYIILNILPACVVGEEEAECPDGYVYEPGAGSGELRQKEVESMAGCGELCGEEGTCCSIEWSPSEKKCLLKTGYQVTHITNQDYTFCRRVAQSKSCAY